MPTTNNYDFMAERNIFEDKIQQLEEENAALKVTFDNKDLAIEKLEQENATLHSKLTANRFIYNTNERHKYQDTITELQLNLVARDRTIEDLDSKLVNSEFTDDYKLQQKAINTLNDSGLKLMEENKELKDKLANQKYLNRQEVEKIFFGCREKPNIDIPQFHINAGKAITAICNLALVDKDKITAILVGKILESNKDAVAIVDEIIKELGGK